MTETPFSKSLVVWWRYGKEHGGEDLRVNQPEVVQDHLRRKVDRFRQTPEGAWRWWQIHAGLIVERPPHFERPFGEDTCIYYLLQMGLSVIEEVNFPPPDERWKWYIHISDFVYDEGLACWLMKDLFCDILVEGDNRTYHVADLPDMARALDVGLITSAESSRILQRIGWLVEALHQNAFPLPEIKAARLAAAQLGWY